MYSIIKSKSLQNLITSTVSMANIPPNATTYIMKRKQTKPLPSGKPAQQAGISPFLIGNASSSFFKVSKIDSPNGGHVFSPEKVTIYGSKKRRHDLKNLVQMVHFPACYCWWKKSCTTQHVGNPVNNEIFTISTGDRRISEPSTVC